MKNKFNLITSIFQIVVGIAAVLAYVVLAINGENMVRWIVTLILSIAFIVIGIIGIVDYKSNK